MDDKPEEEKSAAQVEQAHDDVLKRLPTHQRNSILLQYDLPAIKVSIFTILRYATRFEALLQVTGLLMAIGAGIVFRDES
jgi:hypothetical protein